MSPNAAVAAPPATPATPDLRAVLKGVLRDHFGISAADLATQVFPDSIGVMPMDGLVG